MNPKEYLPNLNRLDKVDNLIKRQFLIEDQLGRHQVALEKLIILKKDGGQDDSIPSVMDYVKKHNLFTAAVKMSGLTSVMQKSVCQSWAQKLQAEGHKLQAALLFHLAGDFELSQEMFITRNRWKLGIAEKEMVQISSELSGPDQGNLAWWINKVRRNFGSVTVFSSDTRKNYREGRL